MAEEPEKLVEGDADLHCWKLRDRLIRAMIAVALAFSAVHVLFEPDLHLRRHAI